ncbi:MAG: YqiA/YcfP family alpha/beta fold hydrolase [Spongiibacteraceae bacterium]
MRPLLIYIHGFLSSSQSQKAQQVRDYIEAEKLPIDFIAPTLSNYPLASYQQLQQLVEQHQPCPVAVIGSSMGGFMATALVQQYGVRAVVINPAIKPYHLIGAVLGQHTNPYTGVDFCLTTEHTDELRQLEVTTINEPEKIMVLLQTGDETLDYRHAVEYYRGCLQQVEEGGDHRFQHFDKHLPNIMKFLNVV